jgi:hypothetical protein
MLKRHAITGGPQMGAIGKIDRRRRSIKRVVTGLVLVPVLLIPMGEISIETSTGDIRIPAVTIRASSVIRSIERILMPTKVGKYNR